MSVLARVNITSQQRIDLPQILGIESYVAYDFRAMIQALVGSSKAYIVRGFEITGKVGLFASVTVADCFVFNPLDNNGSYYLGELAATDVQVELPPSQPFVYIEAAFINVTNAPVSAAYFDPLIYSGTSQGAEFTATQNSQNIIQLEITANTVGFSADALPIAVCVTSNSSITSIKDARPLLFRLGSGGTNLNPAYKFPWSGNRSDPVLVGSGVGNELDSSFRNRDNTGILNDKGITSFKEMFDAITTRIAEISGSSLWYTAGAVNQYVAGLNLSNIFFDTIGHNLQPKPNAIYNWTGTHLQNIGTETIEWKANYTDLSWQLGNTFDTSVIDTRNYSSVAFDVQVNDGDNVFVLLERDVTKNTGNNLSWKNPNPSYSGYNLVSAYVVSGVAGDFAQIANGDYVRKDSQGMSQYYRVVEMATSTAIFSSVDGVVADNSVVALKLNKVIDAVSTEPLRYFRANYSSADINVIAGTQIVTSNNYYWIARRKGDFIWLRDYGPVYKNKDWNIFDRMWSKVKLLREYHNWFLSGGGNIAFETTTGNNRLEWSQPILVEIAGRNATYSIPTGNVTILNGECLWVDVPETEGSTYSLTPQVTALSAVPINPEDSNYSDRILVLFLRRSGTVIGIGDAPDLSSGETNYIGSELSQIVRDRIGIISDTAYENYTSTHIINNTQDYPTALSQLDAQMYDILTDKALEEEYTLLVDATVVQAPTMTWLADVDDVDIKVYVNDIFQTQDKTGGLTKDFRKISTNEVEFSYTIKAGWKVVFRDERTGSGLLGGGGGEANTASNLGTISDGLGTFATKLGVDLQFRRLKAGTNITLTQEANDILIDASGGGGSGEINTASNRGTLISDGEGVFYQKSVYDLQFKRILAGTNVTVSSNNDHIVINSTASGGSGEVNTASNLGTISDGSALFTTKTGVDLPFKRIKAGTNVTLTEETNDVKINVPVVGETNTASNLGASGSSVFSSKVGVDLQFRKLITANTNLTIAQNTNDITFTAATFTGANVGTSGVGIYRDNTTTALNFKKLKAGSNITITATVNDEIQIDASLAGGAGDMLKSTYDTDNNGVVDNASALNSQGPSYYLSRSNHTGTQSYTTVSGLATVASTGTLDSLSDVTAPSPSLNQVLQWNGSAWVNGTVSGSGGGLVRYAASSTAGEEVYVLATGSGITYSRTGTSGTFVIPSGVEMVSAKLRLPMPTIGGNVFTIIYGTNGAGDNTSAANSWRPNYNAWNESSNTQIAVTSNISAGFDRIQIATLTSTVTNIVKLAW